MSRTYQHKDSDKRRFNITLDGILCTRYYDLNIFINMESGIAALVVRTCSLGHEKEKLSDAIARGWVRDKTTYIALTIETTY